MNVRKLTQEGAGSLQVLLRGPVATEFAALFNNRPTYYYFLYRGLNSN